MAQERFVVGEYVYVLETPELKSLAQRVEMGEKFVAEAQHLIRQSKNAGAVLRKLQAARNVLNDRVDDPELAEPEVAQAPVSPSNGHSNDGA